MKTTKILASLVVICMLATCMFCIAGIDDSKGDVIRSDDSVVINIDKSFQENKTELATLGITDYKSWQYNNDYGCYVLVLDNVHFKTTSLHGIELISRSDTANPKVVIKLVGDNSIVSGYKRTLEIQTEEMSCAIASSHMKGEEHVKDMNVIITGDGTLTATNADLSHDIIAAFGIFVYGNLTICDGAHVIAAGSGFDHYCSASHAVDKMEICSCGVYVMERLTVSDANLLGSGGDTNIVFEAQEQSGKKIYYYSEGVIAEKFLIEDSYVHGIGGKVDWNMVKEEYITGLNITSYSDGIAALVDNIGGETYEYSAEIRNSKVVGSANAAKGITGATSRGISIGSEDTIKIVDSMVIGTSGDVFITDDESFSVVGTIGIYLDGNTAINGSYVQGVSGNHATYAKFASAAGINCTENLNTDDSIVVGVELAPATGWLAGSAGIGVSEEFNVNDSEVYAKGVDAAISASELNASLGNRGCYSLDNDGNRTAIDVSDLTGEHTAVELLYAYDVYISTVDGKLISFERSESEYYVVGPYTGFVPDGMKFTGYEETDGDAINIGDTFVVDDPLVLVATFGVAEKSDSGNAVVAWIIVIVALIVVALLVVGLSVSRKLKG